MSDDKGPLSLIMLMMGNDVPHSRPASASSRRNDTNKRPSASRLRAAFVAAASAVAVVGLSRPAFPATATAQPVFMTGQICRPDGCHRVEEMFPDIGACRAEVLRKVRANGHNFSALSCGSAPEVQRDANRAPARACPGSAEAG